MKKLLLFLFSMLISFNSYGGLFDKTVCVETDSQLRDGVIYLPNKTKPFSGKNLCKYESGQNKSKGKIKDGKKNDLWTEWEENGQIKFERTYEFDQIVREKNYQNGIEMNDTSFSYNLKGLIETKGNFKEGILVSRTSYQYLENGLIQVELNYIARPITNSKDYYQTDIDERQGKWGICVSQTDYYYYKNEQIKEKLNWKCGKDSKRDGKSTRWYEDGQKYEEANYKDGKKVSKTTYWRNGEKSKEEDYKEDKLVRRINFFSYGLKSKIELFKDGKKHGTWSTWNERGNKTTEFNFKKGKKDGIETFWWNNRKKRKEANYKDGQLVGKTTFWHKNGEINLTRNFKNGQVSNEQNYLNGVLNQEIKYEYHSDGSLKSKANFQNNNITGKAWKWYANGQMQVEASFVNGVPNGKMREWHENGQIKAESNYKDGNFDGNSTSWNSDGSIKRERVYINGECVSGDC